MVSITATFAVAASVGGNGAAPTMSPDSELVTNISPAVVTAADLCDDPGSCGIAPTAVIDRLFSATLSITASTPLTTAFEPLNIVSESPTSASYYDQRLIPIVVRSSSVFIINTEADPISSSADSTSTSLVDAVTSSAADPTTMATPSASATASFLHSAQLAQSCSALAGSLVNMTFNIRAITQMGDYLYVTGQLPQLGFGNLNDAKVLSADWYTDADPLWNTTIALPAGSLFSYRYMMLLSNGTRLIENDGIDHQVSTACSTDQAYDIWPSAASSLSTSVGPPVSASTASTSQTATTFDTSTISATGLPSSPTPTAFIAAMPHANKFINSKAGVAVAVVVPIVGIATLVCLLLCIGYYNNKRRRKTAVARRKVNPLPAVSILSGSSYQDRTSTYDTQRY